MQKTYYKDKEAYKAKVLRMKPDNTVVHLEKQMEASGVSIFGYQSGSIQKYVTPQALRDKAVEYFTHCIDNKEPVLLGMLYIHLGVTRDYFRNLRNKNKENSTYTSKAFVSVLEQIDTIIEGNLEKSLVTEKQINGHSLVLANRYNWNTSKQQNDNTGTITLDLAGLHHKAQAKRAETLGETVTKGPLSVEHHIETPNSTTIDQ